MTITTTLNRIRAHNPCPDGWNKLLAGLGKTKADDKALTYARIVEINGIKDALWACRAEPQHAREWRLFAVWCARQVEHLMDDPRSVVACNVVERFAHGMATQGELDAARDAAWNAVWSAASSTASSAASSAASNAAWDAAWSAACSAASSAASSAAWDAAWSAACSAARDAQTAKFLEIVGDENRGVT